MKDGIGGASTSRVVVVVTVMTLGRGLEWWERVEVGRKVWVLTRTRVMVGRHHYTRVDCSRRSSFEVEDGLVERGWGKVCKSCGAGAVRPSSCCVIGY